MYPVFEDEYPHTSPYKLIFYHQQQGIAGTDGAMSQSTCGTLPLGTSTLPSFIDRKINGMGVFEKMKVSYHMGGSIHGGSLQMVGL